MIFSNVNLVNLKAFLGIDSADTTNDVYLQMQLDAGLSTLQTLLGRNLEHGNYRDTIYKVSDVIYLTEFPVNKILSITDLGAGVNENEYILNQRQGRITFGRTGYYRGRHCFDRIPNIVVEYEAGYDALPPDMLLAFYGAIDTIFTNRQQAEEYGGAVKRINTYDVGTVDYATTSSGDGTLVSVYSQNFASYIAACNFGNIDQVSELIELLDSSGNPI